MTDAEYLHASITPPNIMTIPKFDPIQLQSYNYAAIQIGIGTNDNILLDTVNRIVTAISNVP